MLRSLDATKTQNEAFKHIFRNERRWTQKLQRAIYWDIMQMKGIQSWRKMMIILLLKIYSSESEIKAAEMNKRPNFFRTKYKFWKRDYNKFRKWRIRKKVVKNSSWYINFKAASTLWRASYYVRRIFWSDWCSRDLWRHIKQLQQLLNQRNIILNQLKFHIFVLLGRLSI